MPTDRGPEAPALGHREHEARYDRTDQQLLPLLAHGERLLGALDGAAPDKNAISTLKDRLEHARFHLAVLGQFKRGKSTLLNALLGEPILPSAIVPVTSVPTFLSWGPSPNVRVVFQDGRTEELMPEGASGMAHLLKRYVTEDGNPKNRLGVAQVDVWHPAPILRRGVVLIDTPGIGSTFVHNTDATLAFISQCDAALFMVSADPPITQAEVEFLGAVRANVARLFFVLNKVDYLMEQDRQAAVDFLKRVLREQAGMDRDLPIFPISARQGLEARLRGDEALWRTSGLGALDEHLSRFLAEDKIQTLQAAVAGKAVAAISDGLMRLRLQRQALTLPLSDLDERLKLFDQRLQEAERQRVLAQDLLTGDRHRSLGLIDQRAERLREETETKLSRAVEEVLGVGGPAHSLEQAARAELAQGVEKTFESALVLISQAVAQQVQEALRVHKARASELIESVRRAAAELFEIPYGALKDADTVQMKHRPYWVTEKWNTSIEIVPAGAIERLLPRALRLKRLKKRLLGEVEAVVMANAENLRWAVIRSVEDAYRRFGADLDRELEAAIDATKGAIVVARRRREEHAGDVALELERLGGLEREIEGLRRELATVAGTPIAAECRETRPAEKE